MVVGTPAYMPPEQINGQHLTPAADIYSLGVVLYELLTGKLPFEGTLGKLIAQIEGAAPPPLRTIRPEIEPALEAICLRALAKKPAQRFSAMAAFAEALEDYLKGRATLTHLAPPTQMFRRPRRYRAALALGGLVAGVAATTVALVVLWFRRDLPIPEPPPDPQQIDIERQIAAMGRPILKVQYRFDDRPTTLSRAFLPESVLNGHGGPLYFMAEGAGRDHIIDLTDQPGQAAQITAFGPGDITVRGTYLLFLGGLVDKTRVFVDGGPGYCILAPMNSGRGCQHLEFGGNHLLMPKLGDPVIEAADVTAEERQKLRNRGLSYKLRWHYLNGADYMIYTWPTIKVVPANEQRKIDFPEIDNIIEFDRKRQNAATTVSNEVVRKALAEDGNR